MGQLMRIRRLEFILQVLHELSLHFPDAHLHIWGAVKDSPYAAALHELIRAHSLQEHVTFKGAYQSDSEVRDSLTTGTLAIIPGWSDPLGTGINAIASANKFFSYLNLGLPILLEDGLDNMVQLAVPSGAALTYQPTATSCAAVVKRIWEDDDLWHTMTKRSLQLSLKLNNECAKHTLRNLYDDLLRRS
jgi:glycosyltransferase involved in cell wall biosynthesis